jgi:hypothetical protein
VVAFDDQGARRWIDPTAPRFFTSADDSNVDLDAHVQGG